MRVRSSGEASNPLIEVNPTQPYGHSAIPKLVFPPSRDSCIGKAVNSVEKA